MGTRCSLLAIEYKVMLPRLKRQWDSFQLVILGESTICIYILALQLFHHSQIESALD